MRALARLALASVLLLGSTLPAAARAQDSGGCDDLSHQVDSANQDLDGLRNDAAPSLQLVTEFAAIAPGELAVAAAQGLPGVPPELAGTYGATAATIGGEVELWRGANESAAADSYWSDLAGRLLDWESRLALTAPAQPVVQSLGAMANAFGELDRLTASARADLALRDSFGQALENCLNAQPPGGPPGGDEPLCAVGGQTGHSNSECFTLELDAAFAVWQACTEAYFAAERAAFRDGGGLPINTCDGPWAQAQADLQRKWTSP